MNFSVRDGSLDVAIVAGPRVENWPSVGVRVLSALCADMGLTVGQFGGQDLLVRGVIPLSTSGGWVVLEDIRSRIHRIRARAIVRVTPESTLPDPFPGWNSQGLIPIQTAEQLLKQSQILWGPTTVILGTGNRALRLGSTLLDQGVPSVFCVETHSAWGAKRFAGWEVETRRFEMAGGKIIEAKPVHLCAISPLVWQLKLQDAQGVRLLEVGRVISAGPFREDGGVREYPPASCLYELDQTAPPTLHDNPEGWALEEERGHWLAGKIIKALIRDLGETKRIEFNRLYKRARGRLKRYMNHREAPFTPSYEGKWIEVSDAKKIRAFEGVPQKAHLTRPIASLECFEQIPCTLCQSVCPTSAIQRGLVLNETACTACNKCVIACPTSSISLLHERENESLSQMTLPWKGNQSWKIGDLPTLINRRGESMGSARITKITTENSLGTETNTPIQLIQLDVPTHLIWEARGVKRNRTSPTLDNDYMNALDRASSEGEKVEITLNGERRLVRDRISISIALFETGQNRQQDRLLCKDGSCGLCDLSVDGVKKSACQTRIHRGMAVRTEKPPLPTSQTLLCPCLGITQEQVIERLQQGKLKSPDAILTVTHVGEGKCHGQLCMGAFKRLMVDQGLETLQWIDWRFPWMDWTLTHSSFQTKTFQS